MFDKLSSRYEPDTYEGMVVHAYPGLHAKLMRLLVRTKPPPATLLDLGCGEGAWGTRCVDFGYQVSGVELTVPEACFPVVKADLNGVFAASIEDKVDVITLIEVIEHVENPRHVLRECHSLLAEDGVLIVSTPNASGLYSRVRFLLTGTMVSFTDLTYATIGHITPVTVWQLRKMAQETGFEISELRFLDSKFFPPSSLADIAKLCCWAFLRPLMSGDVGGQSLVAVMRPRQ